LWPITLPFDAELNGQLAVTDEAAPGPLVPRDQRRSRSARLRATLGGARLGDAGGEEAEIVGEGAVGEVGDACAQDGDRLGG
jgi:hypothetical protein